MKKVVSIAVVRECNYYSSWVLTAEDSDVLYSSIENWIIIGDTVYILILDSATQSQGWKIY